MQRGFLDWMQVEEAEFDLKSLGSFSGFLEFLSVSFQQLALVSHTAAALTRVKGKCSFF